MNICMYVRMYVYMWYCTTVQYSTTHMLYLQYWNSEHNCMPCHDDVLVDVEQHCSATPVQWRWSARCTVHAGHGGQSNLHRKWNIFWWVGIGLQAVLQLTRTVLYHILYNETCVVNADQEVSIGLWSLNSRARSTRVLSTGLSPIDPDWSAFDCYRSKTTCYSYHITTSWCQASPPSNMCCCASWPQQYCHVQVDMYDCGICNDAPMNCERFYGIGNHYYCYAIQLWWTN